MANLVISSRLSQEPQTITIAEGKTFEVDCTAETMVKAQDLFKKDDSIEGIYKAIELLIGKQAVKDIKAMKVRVSGLKTILMAIMAQVNEVPLEEMEARFQNM